jgi:uncharacterized protein (DUF1697 family)
VATLVVLLRGINIGPTNRIAMPALRTALEDAGFGNVRTYVQSGNVVLASRARPAKVAAGVERQIAESFGLEVPVVVRTRDELADVVARDPLGDVATNPKRYQVTFLARKLEPATVEKLESVAAAGERLVVSGLEVFAWHPEGLARSKLASLLAGRGLGTTATARNWTTVTALLALADG